MSGGVSPIPVPCHRIDTNSPPGDSADKGIAERAILIVGGLVRMKKAVVEENVLEGRDAGPRLTAWMVHHAAQVIDLAWSEQTRGASSARRWQVSVNTCGSETRFWKERTSSICLKSSRYIVVDFDGRLRMVRTIKRANADDRWKVVSPRDPVSAADLESTPSSHA